MSKDFMSAQHAIIDPLVEPQPSDETGLNSHFGSTFAPHERITPPGTAHSAHSKNPSTVGVSSHHTGSSVETNPYRRSRAASNAKSHSTVSAAELAPAQNAYPSPPHSASPRREQFSNHRGPFANPPTEASSSRNQGDQGRARRSSNPHHNNTYQASGLNRSGSLRERYPGDTSHRPLDIIRKDTKVASRAHHLRKKNFQGADVIDRLDTVAIGNHYHHEGPFDAANIARNTDVAHSPVAAVRESNEEALRATPRENILDAVTKHRPIENVATMPPGVPDQLGRVLHYEEGADLQREPGGDYKRWGGVDYLPGDLKGKGEPYYSMDKARKDKKETGDSGIEMTSRSRNRNHSLGAADGPESVPLQTPFGDDAAIGRSNTTGNSVGGTLKKRLGSIRRKKVEP